MRDTGERGPVRPLPAWRAAAATGCLATVLVLQVRSVRPTRLLEDVRSARLTATATPDRARATGTSFLFDPAYARFLTAVREATPAGAVIALSVPKTHELYTYQAWYALAPRRLAGPERRAGAQYTASYGNPGKGTRIANGRIERLR